MENMNSGNILIEKDKAIAANAQSEAVTAPDNGVITINGNEYMHDAKGRLVPLESVKETNKLEDQTVRKVIEYARPLAAQVARFRQHTFDDVDALVELLGERYGVKKGGTKGNITLMTFDGLKKVMVQVGENISFGPELQQAKALIDECLKDWTEGSSANLRTLIDRAFQVDKEGKINRNELLGLRRLEITDETGRWKMAMEAINDSVRIIGSKRYARAYTREKITDGWTPIVIDVAAS